jgi:hypothetical protein
MLAWALLVGCLPSRTVVVQPPTVTPEPTPFPSVAPTVPGGATYADVGFSVYGGSLAVSAVSGGRPIVRAHVRVLGSSLAGSFTDAAGRVRIGPLVPGSYRVVVSGEGLQTSVTDGVEIKPREEDTTSLTLELRPEASAAGRVTAAGQPVAQAVVSDGVNSALTDVDGRYKLQGLAPGAVTLTVSKPRFRTATRSHNVAAGIRADIDLSLLAAAPEVHFDLTAGSSLEASALNDLKQHLGGRGWTVLDAPPAQDGVWVLVAPGRDLAAPDRERLVNFVAQGGKLVVLGEWGGHPGFRTGAVNGLLHRVGLHLTSDLVRDMRGGNPTSAPRITRFPEGPLSGSGLGLQVYGAGSVFGLDPMAVLATSSDSSFRVQSLGVVGAHPIVAGGAYRGGKALVVGDASAFVDGDVDENGRSNLDEADNALCFEKLLDW